LGDSYRVVGISKLFFPFCFERAGLVPPPLPPLFPKPPRKDSFGFLPPPPFYPPAPDQDRGTWTFAVGRCKLYFTCRRLSSDNYALATPVYSSSFPYCFFFPGLSTQLLPSFFFVKEGEFFSLAPSPPLVAIMTPPVVLALF